MSSTARIAFRRIANVNASKFRSAVRNAKTRPFTTLGDTMKKKESVEEERYIRKMEKEAMEARIKAAKGDKELEQAMHEAAGVLEVTKDSMSQDGLVNIARWKLGRK